MEQQVPSLAVLLGSGFICTQSMCWEQQYHIPSPRAMWLLGMGSVRQVAVIDSQLTGLLL